MCKPTEMNMENWESGSTCLRLLIADDQPRVRHSLEALLTALHWSVPNRTGIPFKIVGATDNGEQTVAQVQALLPDVVVLDLPTNGYAPKVSDSGAKLDGLTTIRTIKSRWPTVRVVVLTMYATNRVAILRAGADAFLLKGCPTSDLLDAVMPPAS